MQHRSTKIQLVEGLMSIGALRFNFERPFSYASGLKGPIYCDNRKLLGHPKLRQEFILHMLQLIQESNTQFDSFCGLATAGIPHAAWLASQTERPMLYVRSGPKAHGKGQQVEGDFRPGEMTIIVEDLVNQASSLDHAMTALEGVNIIPKAIVCLVSYDTLAAQKKLAQWKIPLLSALSFSDLCQVLGDQGQLTPSEYKELLRWHKAPEAWDKTK